MADLVLHHCQPVQIDGPFIPPLPVTLGFTIGGAAGDGTVDVCAPELPVPASFPTGCSGVLRFPPVSLLIVHFRRNPGGPDEITVSLDSPDV